MPPPPHTHTRLVGPPIAHSSTRLNWVAMFIECPTAAVLVVLNMTRGKIMPVGAFISDSEVATTTASLIASAGGSTSTTQKTPLPRCSYDGPKGTL